MSTQESLSQSVNKAQAEWCRGDTQSTAPRVKTNSFFMFVLAALSSQGGAPEPKM